MKTVKHLDELLNSYNLRNNLAEDKIYVDAFCQNENIKMIDYDVSFENYPAIELIYFFTDNLGGYNIKGIKNSLEDFSK
tara:strand:- start:269 stop:505 length:237 start_codon:yes stop_codon:yes gene_type:complete